MFVVCDPTRAVRIARQRGSFRCHAGLGERGAPMVLNQNEYRESIGRCCASSNLVIEFD